MRWRGEQRFVQQVFPVAGEFATRDQPRHEGMRRAAMPDDVDAVADRQRCGRTALQRRAAQPTQGQHQPEARDLVVGQRVALDGAAVVRGEPDRGRFGDQVADRQHQLAVIDKDDDAVADALGAEDAGGEGVSESRRAGYSANTASRSKPPPPGGAGLSGNAQSFRSPAGFARGDYSRPATHTTIAARATRHGELN
jgi:hypothetical protein